LIVRYKHPRGARTRGFVFPHSLSTRSPRGPILHREHHALAQNRFERHHLRRATTRKCPFSARVQSHGPIVKPSRTFDWHESKCFCREPHQRVAGQALQISCGFRLTVHPTSSKPRPSKPSLDRPIISQSRRQARSL
jgi:hypothetical protein